MTPPLRRAAPRGRAAGVGSIGSSARMRGSAARSVALTRWPVARAKAAAESGSTSVPTGTLASSAVRTSAPTSSTSRRARSAARSSRATPTSLASSGSGPSSRRWIARTAASRAARARDPSTSRPTSSPATIGRPRDSSPSSVCDVRPSRSTAGKRQRRVQQTGQRSDQPAPDRAPGQRGPERRHEVEMPEHRRRALIRRRP